MHQKLVPPSFLILVNHTKHSLYAIISFKIRYFERGLLKSLKKVNFIFSFESSPFEWMKLSKQKGAWNYWPVDLQVTTQVKAIFELFQQLHLQIYASQLRTSWIIPLPFVLFDLESVKREKSQKFEYLKNERAFLIK